jgi:hypothetical protein
MPDNTLFPIESPVAQRQPKTDLVNTPPQCRWGVLSNIVSFRLYKPEKTIPKPLSIAGFHEASIRN